jgi:hypothetical protein
VVIVVVFVLDFVAKEDAFQIPHVILIRMIAMIYV